MQKLFIDIDSASRRFVNRFVYSQVGPEPGTILTVDDINLPAAMQAESDKNDEIIKGAAEKGKAADSFKVYRQNL